MTDISHSSAPPAAAAKKPRRNNRRMKRMGRRVSFLAPLTAMAIAVLALSACGARSGSPSLAHSVIRHHSPDRVHMGKDAAVLGHILFASRASLASAQRSNPIAVSKLRAVKATVEAGKPIAWVAELNPDTGKRVVELSVTRISGLGCHPCAVLVEHRSVQTADIAGILSAHAQKVEHIGAGGYRIDYRTGRKTLATAEFTLTASGSTGGNFSPY